MSYDSSDGIDITKPAAADLSSYQYRFVKVDANGRVNICTACTDKVLGILQNKPAAIDRAAKVRIAGISKHIFGVASDEGDAITSNAQGFGTVAASAGDFVAAWTLAAPGGSGDIQEVVLKSYIRPT